MVDLLVHHETKRALDNYSKNPHHALLLSGTKGLGKTLLAKRLVIEILEIGLADLDKYPYFRVIEPEKGSISIESIRLLASFFARKVPSDKPFNRFVIIDGAELLSQEAGNALLKLLEEPPQGSLIILTTTKLDKILPTIRSRTQIVTVASPEKADVVQYFVQKGQDKTAVERAWLLSGGVPGSITTILDDPTDVDETLAAVKQALSVDTFGRLLLVDGLSKDKESAISFVDTLAQTAETSLDQAATKGGSTVKQWHNILRATEAARQSLQNNGNAKLTLTELMLAL